LTTQFEIWDPADVAERPRAVPGVDVRLDRHAVADVVDRREVVDDERVATTVRVEPVTEPGGPPVLSGGAVQELAVRRQDAELEPVEGVAICLASVPHDAVAPRGLEPVAL
jgi:hypothetical protein